jgi:pimeloyl-ACP methyl ester carboxylesterase
MTPRPADFRGPPRELDHLTRHTRAWHAEGEPEVHEGQRIDVHRRVGGAPLLLLLHGFPTSSFDWQYVLVQDRQHAAVSFDYPGLGCSEKPADGDYSVARVADLAERLHEEHGQGRKVMVVAHDLGVSVAAELMARDAEGRLGMELVGAVLLNGGVAPTDAAREFARKALPHGLRARLGGERHFRHELGRLFSEAHPLSDELAQDQWSVLTHNHGLDAADALLGYLEADPAREERWRGAIREWGQPVHAVWGMADPLSGPSELESLRALRSEIEVVELPDVGHFPQIEAPDRVTAAIRALAAPA